MSETNSWPGLVFTIRPSDKGNSLALKPADGTDAWDLSAFGHVEARVVNTGAKAAMFAVRVDNAGDWRDNPWNTDVSTMPVDPGSLGYINQIQAEPSIGLGFGEALRAMLRQAPNIIMLGEIRDGPTAEIAVRAALTGHLVLSTLHTNDAPSSISRLIDMGIEPFLVSSSCILIQAQRLVRRICKQCKAEIQINPQMLYDIGIKPEEVKGASFFKGKGCATCSITGYKGRVGLYEVMPISPDIRDMILKRVAVTTVRAKAVEQGMLTLRMDAWGKVKQGMTTVEEMIRETAEA